MSAADASEFFPPRRSLTALREAVLRAGEERELAFAALVEDLAVVVVSTALGSG